MRRNLSLHGERCRQKWIRCRSFGIRSDRTMKRYPRRAMVSMNRGLSAESPSASRSLFIAVPRL